jgi:hypothetical protein
MKIPMRAPTLAESLKSKVFAQKLTEIRGVEPLPDGNYLHWDELRHGQSPARLSHGKVA